MTSKEVATDLSPVLRVYKDGTVERLYKSTYVPPSPEDPITGVSSKDITISPNISARIYRPKLSDINQYQKLPILVYFHGGGFCLESAFSSSHHTYLNYIVSEAKAVAVSVEYRLAPEHLMPAGYDDSWASLQWVASHKSLNNTADPEPWLQNYGDFDRIYIGGDSSGGTIVHNMAMRAGGERLPGDVKILGAFLSHPYFLGSEPIGSEPRENHGESLEYGIWKLAYPSAPGGIDNPMINPFVGGAPSLSGLGCCRLLVCVSEKDKGRDRGTKYWESAKESGWGGKLEELIDVEGEGHCFHIYNPQTEKAKNLIRRLASFIE